MNANLFDSHPSMDFQSMRRWLFVLAMMLVAILGGALIHGAASRVTRISGEREADLVAKFGTLKSELAGRESDSLKAFFRAAAPQVNGTQQELLIRRLRRIDPVLREMEADSIRTFVSAAWQTVSEESLMGIVVRDIGIALVIAVFLTFAIELNTRTRFDEEIRSGVIEAVFKRLIPEQIFTQIREHVIKAQTVRKNWRLMMSLREEPSFQTPDDHLLVSSTKLSYTLVNTTGSQCPDYVRAHLDEYLVRRLPDGTQLPRFTRVTIGDTELVGADLEQYIGGDADSHLDCKIDLEKDRPVDIVIELEEVIRVPDAFTWTITGPADGAEVIIDSDHVRGASISVLLNHPDRKSLKIVSPGSHWAFRGGILPYQGFQIITSRVVDSPEPAAEESSAA